MRGSFRKKRGEATEGEVHTESNSQNWGGGRGIGGQAAETGKEAVARAGSGRCSDDGTSAKAAARVLSAARRPVVFSLSQPGFNCRFIFRQTGCLHLRLSASRLLERKEVVSPTPAAGGRGLLRGCC